MDHCLEEPRDPKRFWGVGEVLKLALPTSLGMVNVTLMQFVDGLMVAHIQPNGAEALSAQFVGGMFSFVSTALAMGTLGVVNTFVAQNLGAGRRRRCSQYAWAGLYLAWAYALLTLPLVPLARPIFGLLGHTPSVQAMEAMYFRYMIWGQGIFLANRVLERFFYAVHRPAVVYAVSLVANGTNLVGDYALIFGKWGLPRLGLQGAAIATLGGAGAGLLVLAGIFLLGKASKQFQTRTQCRLRYDRMREILRVGWPAGLQFFIDILGWGVGVTALIGSIQTINGVLDPNASTVHLAASSVVMRYLHVSFMPAMGIGIATTTLVGRYIGAKQPHLARRRAHAAMFLAMGYMGMCGVFFLLWRFPLIRFFLTVSPTADPQATEWTAQIVAIGGTVMICAAVFQVFDAVGIVFVSALRGAGDTLSPMLVSATLALVLIIGGGTLILHVWPELESIGVWIAASAFVIVLGLVMFGRFRAERWRKIDLLGETTADVDER